MSEASATSFLVMRNRSLKRRGVRGYPRGWIEDQTLRIKGDTELAIPFARIEHVRVGPVFSGKRTRYAATLRVAGEATPLELDTFRSPPEFAVAMRRLASVVMAKRGIGAVEGGTPLWRSLPPILPLSLSLPAVGYHLAQVTGLGSPARIALALLGLAVTVPVWREAFRNAPRRIVSMHELDRFLPRPAPAPAQQGGLAT